MTELCFKFDDKMNQKIIRHVRRKDQRLQAGTLISIFLLLISIAGICIYGNALFNGRKVYQSWKWNSCLLSALIVTIVWILLLLKYKKTRTSLPYQMYRNMSLTLSDNVLKITFWLNEKNRQDQTEGFPFNEKYVYTISKKNVGKIKIDAKMKTCTILGHGDFSVPWYYSEKKYPTKNAPVHLKAFTSKSPSYHFDAESFNFQLAFENSEKLETLLSSWYKN